MLNFIGGARRCEIKESPKSQKLCPNNHGWMGYYLNVTFLEKSHSLCNDSHRKRKITYAPHYFKLYIIHNITYSYTFIKIYSLFLKAKPYFFTYLFVLKTIISM